MICNTSKNINKNMFILYLGDDGTFRVIPRPKDYETYKNNLDIAVIFNHYVDEVSELSYIDSRVRETFIEIMAEIAAQDMYFEDCLESTLEEGADIEKLMKVDGLTACIARGKYRNKDKYSVGFKLGTEDGCPFTVEELEFMTPRIRPSLDSNDLENSVQTMKELLDLELKDFIKGLVVFSYNFNRSNFLRKSMIFQEDLPTLQPLLFLW